MIKTPVIVLGVVMCIFNVNHPADAQSKGSSQKAPTIQQPNKNALPLPEELERQAKNDFALSLIISLADDARKYDDRVASVRVQARVADLLWETDVERARTIFRRAWSLAAEVEAEEWKRVEEKKRKYLSGEIQTGFIPLPPNLRGEILQFVARRDKTLTEELLAELEKKDADSDSAKSDNFDPTEPDLATERRLELAIFLLEKGEVEKALSIADASLQRATTQGVLFLLALRRKSPDAADARYSNLLTKAATDPTADATSVSLLSAYAFTPTVIVTTTQNGTLSRKLDAQNIGAIPERLKYNFLQTAAQILLRPLPPVEQDRTSAGRDGLFFTITRLLPLFEQYLPDKVQLLQSQLGLITQNVSDETRSRTAFFSKAGFSSDAPSERQLDEVLQEIDSTQNKARRDNLYALAARLAAAKEDERARDLAEKISNTDLKDRVTAYVDFVLIRSLIQKKQADKAMALLSKLKLSPLQRIWFMTEIAGLYGKAKEDEARRVLEDAASEAHKVNRDEAWKANALSVVANSFLSFDELRAWQLTGEAVEAANAAASFKDESELSVTLQTGGNISMLKINAPTLSVTNLFAALAPRDIYQAAALAKNLKDEYQKALSLLAVAESQLKKENEPKAARTQNKQAA